MQNTSIEVEILVNGKPVKKFSHEGKTFIQANKGSEYSIKVKNNSANRRMFNVSVDGINVVNGEAAGKILFGYVLSGYSAYEIKGFRTSNEEVHPFKFNDKQKSYAAKSDETNGDVSNCGVIGVQVYEEKEKPQPIVKHIHHHHKEKEYIPYPVYPRYPRNPWWSQDVFYGTVRTDPNTWTSTYNNAPSAKGMSMTYSANNSSSESMMRCANFMSHTQPVSTDTDGSSVVTDWAAGTEFSDHSVTDKVTSTSFEVGFLLTTVEIFYDYREGLVNKGVPIHKEVKIASPQAFPTNFCKPPRN